MTSKEGGESYEPFQVVCHPPQEPPPDQKQGGHQDDEPILDHCTKPIVWINAHTVNVGLPEAGSALGSSRGDGMKADRWQLPSPNTAREKRQLIMFARPYYG